MIFSINSNITYSVYSISPQYAQCTTPHSANCIIFTIIQQNSMIFKTSILGISDAISQIQKISATEGLNGLFDANTVKQYTLAISGLNKQEAITLLQRQGLSKAQQAQILSSAGLLQTTKMLNASLVEEAVLNSKISGEKAEQVLTELGLIEAKTGNLIVTKECTVAEVAQALATKGIVGSDAEAILSQLGLATANTTATVSFAGLTTAIKANTIAMAKWLVTNPIGWCILAVGAIYGLIKAYDALTVSEEEMAKAHEESVQKAKDSVSEYEELKQELETIQQTYDDNEQKLKDLYKLRENQTITKAEQDYLEELEGQNEKLRQQIEYKQTLADIEAQEAEDDAVKALNEKTQDDLLTGRSTNGGATVEFDKITDAEKIKQNTATINALTADLTAYEKVIKGINLSQEEVDRYTQQLAGYQEQLNAIEGESDYANSQREFYQGKIDEIQRLLNGTLTYEEYEKAVSEATNSTQSLVKENNTLLEKVEPLNDAIKSTSGKNYELKKSNDEIIANAKDAAIGFSNYTDSLNKTSNALSDVQKSSDETDIQFSDIFALKDSEGKLNELGKINEEIDKFQSAYKGLKEAMDSYNETGTFTLDQVQEIISYGGDYLKYLMDENGNLQLNEEALNKVAIARINEMRAKALSNLMDNLDKITNEEQALSYLETQLLNTATAYDDLTANRIKAWSENALENGISQETINKVTKSFENQVSAINEMFNNISLDSIYKSSSSSAKSATKDAEQATKDYIDSYMDYMEKSLESGRIDYQTYSRDVAKFLKDMYDQGKIAAKDYHDYTKEMLEVQKSIYDKAISGIVYILDQEIDRLDKEKELIESNYQAKIDAIQSEIDALNEANEARQEQIDLEKAQYELEKAQNQRVNKVYNGEQFVYKADSSAIRDAEDEVAQRKNDIKISQLESQIKSLENAMESETKAIDDQIAKYEEYKEQIQDVADAYENAENVKYALAVTGLSSETEILQCRTDVLNTFKDNYIAIQQAIADAAWASANEQIKAAQEAEKAAQGNVGSSGKIGGTNTSVNKVEGIWDNSNSASSSIEDINSLNSYYQNAKKKQYSNSVKKKKYGTGTDNAEPGWHIVSENGKEIIRDNYGNAFVTNGETMYPFEGGEIVINASETEKILANMDNITPLQNYANPLSGLNFQPIDYSSMVMSNLNLPDFSKLAMNRGESTTISIGDIHLHEVQNVPDFAKALQKHLPNISVQYNGKH